MDIEQSIKDWVDKEINDAKKQGIKSKEMRKGISVAMFQLKKIASRQVEKHVDADNPNKDFKWCQRCGGESFNKEFCKDCQDRLAQHEIYKKKKEAQTQ